MCYFLNLFKAHTAGVTDRIDPLLNRGKGCGSTDYWWKLDNIVIQHYIWLVFMLHYSFSIISYLMIQNHIKQKSQFNSGLQIFPMLPSPILYFWVMVKSIRLFSPCTASPLANHTTLWFNSENDQMENPVDIKVRVLALGCSSVRCCVWSECDSPISVNHIDTFSTSVTPTGLFMKTIITRALIILLKLYLEHTVSIYYAIKNYLHCWIITIYFLG